MTGKAFMRWLDAMRDAGRIMYDVDAAKLMDISHNTLVTYKRHGTDIRVALACAALLKGIKPYK